MYKEEKKEGREKGDRKRKKKRKKREKPTFSTRDGFQLNLSFALFPFPSLTTEKTPRWFCST